MTRAPLLRTVLVSAVIILSGGFAPSPVAAEPAPVVDVSSRPARSPDQAQRSLTARIDKRLATLRALQNRVDGAEHLTDAHEAALDAVIGRAVQGLTALRTTVAARTTAESVKQDATSMVRDFRVYRLIAMQVRLTIAADNAEAGIDRLNGIADKLATAIAAAEQAGTDTTAAQAELAALRETLATAEADLTGVADRLLATVPGHDGSAVAAEVTRSRSKIKAVRNHLRAAVTDAKHSRTLLRRTTI